MSTAETPRIKQSLSFIAYEKIKAMILNMELQPGSSLTEMWLIGKLDMSRTPIREALYRLQQERFVELTRHKGWYVSEIKLRDIQELFVIREALEGICARYATARISDEALTKMEAYLDSLKAPLLANEEAVVDPGDTLHDLIFTYADNQLINTMMAIHLERLRMFHVIASNLPGRKLQSWREHREILYALKARDEDRVEQTMRRHIRSSLDSLLQDLLQKNQTFNAL